MNKRLTTILQALRLTGPHDPEEFDLDAILYAFGPVFPSFEPPVVDDAPLELYPRLTPEDEDALSHLCATYGILPLLEGMAARTPSPLLKASLHEVIATIECGILEQITI